MERPPLPPVVYAPTLTDDEGQNRLRMHRLRDERVALFVYSAMDRLLAQYGDDASWVLLSVSDLEAAHQASPSSCSSWTVTLHPEEAAHG